MSYDDRVWRHRQRRRPAVAGLLLALSAGTTTAWAVSAEDEMKRLEERGPTISLESVIEKAQARQPGRMIEAEVEELHGRVVYEIEILDDEGRVWELLFDARTGKFIERTED